MAKSESKSLKAIIKQGNDEKKRIDDRIKSAKAKAGRAYYDFLNSNYHIEVSKFSNGRIKSMKIKRNGKEIDLMKHSPHSNSDSTKSSEASKSDYRSAVSHNQSSSFADSMTPNEPHLINPNQH